MKWTSLQCIMINTISLNELGHYYITLYSTNDLGILARELNNLHIFCASYYIGIYILGYCNIFVSSFAFIPHKYIILNYHIPVLSLYLVHHKYMCMGSRPSHERSIKYNNIAGLKPVRFMENAIIQIRRILTTPESLYTYY